MTVSYTHLDVYKRQEQSNTDELRDIHKLLKIAWDKYQDDDRYVNVSSAGQYIKRAKPDFDARTYGFMKLPDPVSYTHLDVYKRQAYFYVTFFNLFIFSWKTP